MSVHVRMRAHDLHLCLRIPQAVPVCCMMMKGMHKHTAINIKDRTNHKNTQKKNCPSNLHTAHRYKISSMHPGQDSG